MHKKVQSAASAGRVAPVDYERWDFYDAFHCSSVLGRQGYYSFVEFLNPSALGQQ